MKNKLAITLVASLISLSALPASAAVQNDVGSWGLDRIDQASGIAALDKTFTYPDLAGAGVRV
jgi:hypothetical protein